MDNPLRWKVIEHEGKKVHEGVHALIQRNGKFLLLQRRFPPFGYALVAGHLEKGEEPEAGLVREVKEEIRANVSNAHFLFSTLDNEGCYVYKHWTHVFSCGIDKDPILNYESKSYGWFSPDKITNLNLTKITRQILEHLLII
jgi:8-oxo-dGTP pyrophosphatase MutT (NUDIX family)